MTTRILGLCLPAMLSACSLTAFSELDFAGDTGGGVTPDGLVDSGGDDGYTTPDDDDEGLGGTDGLEPEKCMDGIDNDGDGDTDCDDSDCDDTCDADGDGELGMSFGGPDCDDDDRNVNTSAEEVCGDGIDNDCVGGDCTEFVSDFENGPGAGWMPGGTSGWQIINGVGRGGSKAFRSGTISNSQDSGATLTLDFATGGSLEFWHSGSTETPYDELQFYIDGVESGTWSGEWSWTKETVSVPAGTHDFAWRYVKDGSLSSGDDRALIDDVMATGGLL